jgi:hypothetical protein
MNSNCALYLEKEEARPRGRPRGQRFAKGWEGKVQAPEDAGSIGWMPASALTGRNTRRVQVVGNLAERA